MSDQIIFCYVDKDREGLFRDLTDENSGIAFLSSHKVYTGKISRLIERILLSNHLSGRAMDPLQRRCYNLDAYDYQKDSRYYLIIPSTSISKLSAEYLSAFRRSHQNVRLIALLTDSMHASSPHLQYVRPKLQNELWDLILTYDKHDAEEYGFQWIGYSYYSIQPDVRTDEIPSDLYYVGYNKGNRESLISSLYHVSIKNGVRSRFDIVSKQRSDDPDLPYLKKKLRYRDVLSRVQSSNTILEVLQEGQEQQSIRYFEAVIYNKKLLSTNVHITELPYYDSRYMKSFNSLEEIDFDWVKRKEEIDYGYLGDFSPLGMVNTIKDYFKIKK